MLFTQFTIFYQLFRVIRKNSNVLIYEQFFLIFIMVHRCCLAFVLIADCSLNNFQLKLSYLFLNSFTDFHGLVNVLYVFFIIAFAFHGPRRVEIELKSDWKQIEFLFKIHRNLFLSQSPHLPTLGWFLVIYSATLCLFCWLELYF